jgi:hypothetical protein
MHIWNVKNLFPVVDDIGESKIEPLTTHIFYILKILLHMPIWFLPQSNFKSEGILQNLKNDSSNKWCEE